MRLPYVTILSVASCLGLSVALKETGNKVFEKIGRYLSDSKDEKNVVDIVNHKFSSTKKDLVIMEEDLKMARIQYEKLPALAFHRTEGKINDGILTFTDNGSYLGVIVNIENGKVVGIGVDN